MRSGYKRVMQTVMSIFETNAYYAYVATSRIRDSKFELNREHWKLALYQNLLHNPYG